MDLNWTNQLLEQLTWWWDNHTRPHLTGLSDEEYFWEPVPGMWSIRPRAEARTTTPVGAGDWICDFAFPEPSPVPVTTIAWRLGHVIVGIFGMRNASHFGGPPVDYATYRWPATATDALVALDDAYRIWVEGVAGLDEVRLASKVGPAEGPYAEYPFAALVLHSNREALHHLAEVLLLRDLYAAQNR